MRGLLYKLVRETWLLTILFGAGLAIVTGILTFVLPQIQNEFTEIWLRMPFIRNMLGALLGVDIDENFTGQMMQSILFVHPVVLSLFWAHELTFCTRVPVSEIDRGTIDVLLSLPVRRSTLYLVETVGWLTSGVVLIGMGQVGYLVGIQAMNITDRPAADRVAIIMLNLFGLYLAVGGFTFLVSALSDRRGRAIGIGFGVVLASFLLNFVAGLWEPARSFAFLSVLSYYQPALIISGGNVPWGDLAVLGSIGLVTWGAGGVVFLRRSICTV